MSDKIIAEKVWLGSKPEACEICDGNYEGVMVDGRSGQHPLSPWGLLCLSCFQARTGGRLGIGYGQMYIYNDEDDSWVLVMGGEE
ncbi:MAG: hypothetical protein HOC79_05335 [Euryarchaeota archaeon]|nr:hypothetical protein [Euryarchaeota archaeon]